MSFILEQARTLKHALVALLAASIASGCASVSVPGAPQEQTQPAASLPDCITDNYLPGHGFIALRAYVAPQAETTGTVVR